LPLIIDLWPDKYAVNIGLAWNRLGMVSLDSTLTIHAVFIRR